MEKNEKPKKPKAPTAKSLAELLGIEPNRVTANEFLPGRFDIWLGTGQKGQDEYNAFAAAMVKAEIKHELRMENLIGGYRAAITLVKA